MLLNLIVFVLVMLVMVPVCCGLSWLIFVWSMK